MTTKKMYKELLEIDPIMAKRIHPNNTRKIQRSLEIYYQTGIPQSHWNAKQAENRENLEKYFDACAFWVHCEKEVLLDRLKKR